MYGLTKQDNQFCIQLLKTSVLCIEGKKSAPYTMLKTHHTRSVSLPSGHHPVIAQFDEVLSRLKSSEAGSSSLICSTLSGLHTLHECVDDLLLMPENQKALAQVYNEKQANEILHGSLRALDVCGAAKDYASQTKECTYKLQSSIRRRVGEPSLSKEVREYMIQRRNARKVAQKVSRNSASLHNFTNNDDIAAPIAGMLREVLKITITVLESVLTFISGSKGPAPTKWSLVSKLMQSTRSCEEPTGNEFSKVDVMLQSQVSQKTINSMLMQKLQTQLGNLEMSIQDLEDGIDSLFRRLIKTRVSLLNILNQ